LNHRNIIKPVAIRRDSSSTIGILMEFANLGTLYDRIHNHFVKINPPSYAAQIVDAMVYLYSRKNPIMHKDLKSKNILISEHVIKVADFGLAEMSSSQADSMFSTTGYQTILSPERFCLDSKGNPQLFTEKADVFSFGLILWELLTRMELVVECYQLPSDPVSYKINPKVWRLVEGNEKSEDFLIKVARGARPKIPDHCPHKEYIRLMQRCWQDNPEERPTFQEIQTNLRQISFFQIPHPSPFKITIPGPTPKSIVSGSYV